MKKRILALFLAGIMTFTMTPGEAFAAAVNKETIAAGEGAEEAAESEEALLEHAVQPEEDKDSEENTEDEIQSEETSSPIKETLGDTAEAKQELVNFANIDSEEPVELAFPEEEVDSETGIPENWMPPVGGVERPEVILMPEEAASSLDVLDITENGEDGMLYRSRTLGSQQYSSAWDIYSSNYIYNRLGEKEKQFWDALDVISLEYLTGNQNAVSQPLESGETYYISGKGVTYSFLGLSVNRASELFLLFTYANPQYYFWDQGYLRTSSAIYPVFYDAFASGGARASETAKVKAQVDAMEAQIAAGATELDKIKIAHDLITQKVKYDHGINLSNPSASQTQTPYHQSAYSVFCTDYTVCAGYTKAFTMLMNGAGIDAISVTSLSHAWNMVSLNDSWYQIDCTWDDMDGQYGREMMYGYFNRSTARITGDLDQQNSHQMESCYNGMVPKCTQDSGATTDSIGTYQTPAAKTATPVITQQQDSDSVKVILTTDTSGADIYYTTDGSSPSSSASRCFYYSGPFEAEPDVTVTAIAVCDTFWDSDVSSAKVVAKTYTVKFDSGGGSKVSSQKVTAGKTIKKPSNPKRAKYTFDGWYTSKSYKTKWNFSNKVTKDMTLYAKWTKVAVKKATISKLTNVSGKKMKVTVKKVSGAKGYEIRYATNSKMKSSKKVSGTSTSKTIKGLKKGKTYYVQARAYKLDSKNKKVYGSWSGTKTVKIQK